MYLLSINFHLKITKISRIMGLKSARRINNITMKQRALQTSVYNIQSQKGTVSSR